MKKTFKEIVPEYCQYAKVFSEVESKHLSEHKFYNYTINLKLEIPKTVWSKVYLMPVNKQEELN